VVLIRGQMPLTNCPSCGHRFNSTFRHGSPFCSEECKEYASPSIPSTTPPRIKERIEKHNIDLSPPKPCIYFIQCGDDGPVKIGVTINLPARLRDLQAANPYELKVLTVIEDGGQKQERELHDRFKHLEIRREWFKPDKELLSFVDEVRGAEDGY